MDTLTALAPFSRFVERGMVRRRTTHFRLSSLFLITAIVAVAFGFAHSIRPNDASFAFEVLSGLFALFAIFATALTVYLIRFCVKDVLGHKIVAPSNLSCQSSSDAEVDVRKRSENTRKTQRDAH